uniref:Uncharacterized protein n=1 Tax=Nelumbo nucifera TaxID=4432 RepID=A0A822ZE24_NELNU|nr:TPA_asm: hypothetical protein HUJ06_001612 [Nelumbo nucifera]
MDGCFALNFWMNTKLLFCWFWHEYKPISCADFGINTMSSY